MALPRLEPEVILSLALLLDIPSWRRGQDARQNVVELSSVVPLLNSE
jgi:hypothetical protein